jgi:FkbM family methyltransferase
MMKAVPAEPSSYAHEVPTAFIDIARKLAPPQPVICDIGSRDALDGIHLARHLNASELHIFEPNPSAIETCRANIATYGAGREVMFNPIAVSDTIGTVDFFPVNTAESQNKDIGFSSMFPVNPAYTARRQKIVQDRVTVDTTTLDAYFAGRSSLPDILWIDVEGAELRVFKGAEEMLRHVSAIHVEVSFRPMQVGKPLFWEIDAFLKGRGFDVLGFPPASPLKAFLVVHRLLPNLPWRWNAIYGRRK